MASTYVAIDSLKVDNPGQPDEKVYPYGESTEITIEEQGPVDYRVDAQNCSLILLVAEFTDGGKEWTHHVWPYPAQEGPLQPLSLNLPDGAKVKVRAYLGRSKEGRTGYAHVNILTNEAAA